MELSRYIRIVTGHNNLFYHRHNIDPLNNNDICRFCLEESETFIHFFTDCPALWRERRDHIHQYIGSRDTEWRPQQLVDLSFSPAITAALEMKHSDSDEDLRLGDVGGRSNGNVEEESESDRETDESTDAELELDP